MTSDEQRKPYQTDSVKSKRGRPRGKVASMALSVARDQVRKLDWSGDWQAPLSLAVQPVARDVAAGRIEQSEYRTGIEAVIRASAGDDAYDANAEQIEFISNTALSVEIEKRDEQVAESVVKPDEIQPGWLPKEGDFVVAGNGTYRRLTDGMRYVCSRFDITARYTGTGHGWIAKINGTEVQVPANVGELRAAELTALLVSHGLSTDESRDRHDDLVALFKRSRPEGNIKFVAVGGWHDGRKVYVLPDAAYGPGVAGREFRIEGSSHHHFNTAGTIEQWKAEIATPCIGNDVLTFAVSGACAAPFAGTILNLPGMIHIVGPTSQGKSTSLRAAGSFWGGGGPDGYLLSWDTTTNAAIGRAVQHSDALMCFDELKRAKKGTVGDVAYQLSMGQGRSRMRGGQRGGVEIARLEKFNALVLSAGELSIESKIAADGDTIAGGQDVRAPSIQTGDDEGFPIFLELHGSESAQEFSGRISEAARHVYGTAGRVFVEMIANDYAKAESRIKEIADKWMQRYVDPVKGLAPDIRRTATRFAAIAGAGELATEFSILPWPKGSAFRSTGTTFLRWLDARSKKPKDIVVGENALRTFLARNESRFARMQAIDGPRMEPSWDKPANRVGCIVHIDGIEHYAVHLEVLRSELKDVNVATILKALASESVIKRGDSRNIARKVATPEGRSRLVCIARSFVHDDCDMDEPVRNSVLDDMPVDDDRPF